MSKSRKTAMTHVSVEVLDQIRKERDIAIQQLEELGTCLGEKLRLREDALQSRRLRRIGNIFGKKSGKLLKMGSLK